MVWQLITLWVMSANIGDTMKDSQSFTKNKRDRSQLEVRYVRTNMSTVQR